MRFEFATPTRIVFGAGTIREAGPIAKGFGARAMVVTGRTPTRAEPVLAALRAHGVSAVTFSVEGEPDVKAVRTGTSLAKEEACDLVIAFGGGGALDAGKAIAAMLTNEGELLDYLEIIGHGRALAAAPAPFIAIPTTAGSGSEATRNSVLVSPKHRVKVSLRSPLMLPKLALIDPEMTYELPPDITATTGLDALAQLIEPFVSTRANPMTDALCSDGISRVARSLRKACANGMDVQAREDMALASLFGGIALANAGLGAVHGLAAPLGGMFTAPHGAVCAALLPHVVATNLRALRRRRPESIALPRYDRIAELLTLREGATADDGVEYLRRLLTELGIPRLRTFGITLDRTADLMEKAARASSMKANPIELTFEELAEAFESAV